MHIKSEHTFVASDGAALYYQAWHPHGPSQKALLVFHRGHEHSQRLVETIEALDLQDFHIFAWDARGHGRSPGERGAADSFALMVQDAAYFACHIMETHGIPMENMALLAHSVGAALAAAWVHDYAPPLKAMVLAAPAFRVKLYLPFAMPALRLKQKLFGKGYVKSYVKAKVLTHDPKQVEAYQQDPAIFKQIAVNILLDLYDTSKRVVADAGAITVPTLLLVAEKDWVVRKDAQWAFYERLSSPVKQYTVLPGFFHAVFHERNRALAVQHSRRFLRQAFDEPAQAPALTQADRGGYTRTEYDRLCLRQTFSHWHLVKAVMKTVGKLSRGIRLGWERGFDSGETLDYIYANQAHGMLLSKWIDKAYLHNLGWRGIRMRKVHLEALLRQAMQQLHAQGTPVRIVDIATGVGRYVLDALLAMPEVNATALLRDYKIANLEAGRRLAESLNVPGVSYEQADAFSPASYQLSPRPTLAIASGVFELFPDNAPIRLALKHLAECIAPGGFLLYTNQPWHPQLTFIAKVLTNREGEPWIMRRRTQAEMDALVAEAGFEKRETRIDPWGIFTVSVARRQD